MLILLPPSEGKADSGVGGPVKTALSLPKLKAARLRVLEALVELCKGDEDTALKALGLSEGQRDEVRRNRGLKRAATLPAEQVYTGVLYEALGLGELGPEARELARSSILIFSGLWGVVRVDDQIPPYRCSVGARLPGVGGLATFWRKALTGVLPEAGVVLDLRSSPYVPMWTPKANHVSVRVLHDGKIVSHFNKATKGRIVRDLLVSGSVPTGPAELTTALRDLKYTVQQRDGGIDILVTEL